MPKRRRLARGIYEDDYGRSVIVSVNGKPQETRFPRDKPLEHLIRWRKHETSRVAELAPRDPRGSLARDAVTFLKRLKGKAGYKAEKSHLKSWVQYFGRRRRRWEIETEDVELAIAAWREAGYAARTIRHRCRTLQSLYRRLDRRVGGALPPTPVDTAQLPAKPKPRPVTVSDELIANVARQLRMQENPGVGRLRDSKTRARFLVLATCGRRPAEVMRAERADIDLSRRLWFTRTAKGGVNTVVLLNDEMLAAWQLFIGANAWGKYDARSFSKTLKRNGWPTAIRPYNLRHSTAVAIRTRGGDLHEVREQLGHASLQTSEFYLHAVPSPLTSARLSGRFTPAVFLPSVKARAK